jgi:hypothetical protein
MRSLFLVLTLELLCLLGFGQEAKGQGSVQPRPIAVQRDVSLERNVSARHSLMTARLKPEAKIKLGVASLALRKELAKSTEPADFAELARSEVSKQFAGLSPAQLDLLSFYALADAVELETKESDGGKVATASGSMSQMGDAQSMRLQMSMDRRSKAITALSNMMKKISETSDSIVGNLK